MRRQLAVSTNSSAQDIESITTIEMLGEGTVGGVCCALHAVGCMCGLHVRGMHAHQ